MTVRLYEGDKTETGGAGIEITDNKVVNLKLREEDNLIIINDDDEAYVDLQLADGIKTTDDLPVGVTTGRVLVADGRPVAGTMLCFKTTSGDYATWIYGDDGKLYVDNGTGTFKQVYTKPEVDALFSALATVAHTGDYNDLINKPTLGTASALDVGTNPGEIPVIGSNGKLPGIIIPSVGAMNVYTVNTYGDLTTLSQAVQGDIGVVVNDNKTYILSADPYSTLSNWVELRFPTGAVSSVNGQTGAVTLTTFDINEAGDSLYCTSAEKTAWNNKLDANDVSAVALSGSFADLTGKPVIDSTLSTSSTNAIQNGAVATAVNTINNTISGIQGDVSALQTAVGGATGDIDDIKGDISDLQDDVVDLQTGKQDTLVSGTNIKTINGESLLGSGNIDLSSIVITGASFGAFSRACIDSGTEHKVTINKYYDWQGSTIVDNTGTESYTMQGLGWFTGVSTSSNSCRVKIEVNGLTIWEEYNTAGNYVTKYLSTPITLSAGDVVSVTCTRGTGTIGNISANISDFY